MISKLSIENFKCFANVSVEFNNLTVLSGANSNGKSTVIQALLFFRQTLERIGLVSEWVDSYVLSQATIIHRVPLNGDYCLALGNSSNIQNQYAKGRTTIGVHENNISGAFYFESDELEEQLFLTNVGKKISTGGYEMSIFKPWFYYLNTERIGPRIQQTIEHIRYPHAGWQGEYTAQLINRERGYWKVDSARKFEGRGSNYLSEQVNFWLDFIMPGTRVSSITDTKTLSAQLLLQNKYTISEPTIATNIGFGISYVLPIIANGLVAERNSILIVENPETHLHPSAQTKIATFLAMVANAGVQVVVETHSDHFINGIQIAVAKNNVPHKLVTINYFSQQEDMYQPKVTPIYLSNKGELSEWPKGFFDQTQLNYAELFKIRKV